MKRTLCISDIHGCYSEFTELLSLIKFNPEEDDLILLGDYCDRGSKSKEVIELIVNMQNEHNIICLRGNHDQMFIDALNGKEDYLFLHNGGITTIESYCGLNWFDDYQGFDYDRYVEAKEFIKKHYAHHYKFLKSLPFYHESDEYIFAHAGINPLYEDWKKQPIDDFIWIRDIFINNITMVDKTVIFGHTPTININQTEEIWFGGDKIGVDGGCCFGYRLNCLEINDEDGYKQYFVESKRKRKIVKER